jgi:signal transduction histidine kinase
LFTAAARRHIGRLRRALVPQAGRLERHFRSQLRGHGWTAEQIRILLAVSPITCARVSSLARFVEQVGRDGRRLANLNVSLDEAVAALEQLGRLIHRAVDGCFEPAREQLQLATRLVLDRAYFIEEVSKGARLEAEVRRLQAEACHAEEEERRRIGRELHDEAGQALMLLRLQLEMLGRDAPEPLRARLAESCDLAGRTAVELRRIVAALSPALLERLGLETAVRQLTARFGKIHSARVRLRVHLPNKPISRPVAEVVYRVAQECLHNIARHSQATAVNLNLLTADKNIELSVRDNGAGFCADQVGGQPKSFGLTGMRERAKLLGGTLRVTSSPGQGARIRLELPLDAARVISNGKNSHTVDR